MPRSLAATEFGKELIQKALDAKGWTAEDLSLYFDDNSEMSVARSTAYNFCNGLNVRPEKFQAMCGVLNLDWELVSGRKGQTVSEPESPPAPNSGGAEPVEKAHLLQLHPDNLSEILDEGWQKSVRQCLMAHGKGDDFLSVVKQVIDYSVANEELQKFSTWIQEKSSLKERRKAAAMRAFYLAMSFDPIGVIACLQDLEIMLGFGKSLSQPYIDFNDQPSRIEEFSISCLNSSSKTSPSEPILRQAVTDTNRVLSCQMTAKLLLLYEKKVSPFTRACYSGLVQTLNNEFRDNLADIVSDIITIPFSNIDRVNAWWSVRGDAWIEKLYNIITEYQDLLEGVRCLDNEQQQIIRKYNDANIFLVELLNIENAASPEVRQEIEDNLLLPIAELKRRLPDQYGGIEES